MQTVCTTSIIAYERYDKPTGRAQCGYVPHAVLLRQRSDAILKTAKKERLIPINDRKTFNADSIMKNAYIAWYKNAIKDDLAWD